MKTNFHRRFWTAVTAILLALAGHVAQAQSAYRDLTPGTSTRRDVERVLGSATRAIGPTVAEYASEGVAGVLVEYSRAGVIERIDVSFSQPVTRRALVVGFNLPAGDGTRATKNGRLVEYFAGSALLAFVYATADEASGVASIAHYNHPSFVAASGLNIPAPAAPASVPATANPNANANAGTTAAAPPPAPLTKTQKVIGGALVVLGAIQAARAARAGAAGQQQGWTVNNQASLEGERLTFYSTNTAEQCQADCANNASCRGYTFIRAGAYNPNDAAMCYLMSSVTKATAASCCSSGVKGGNQQ